MTDDPTFGRELEEDHDLLTYNESGARLRQEITETKAALQELATTDSTDEEADSRLQQRLEQLEETLQRNENLAVDDEHAARFLAYDGPGSTVSGVHRRSNKG